jgi:large subunit ribosomal protein L32
MVVRMRRNHSQTAKRRSHHAIAGVRLSKCECGELRVSHRACPNCGKYNGKIVIDVVARAKRATRRTKRKQTSLRESGRDTSTKETEEVTPAKT